MKTVLTSKFGKFGTVRIAILKKYLFLKCRVLQIKDIGVVL
jgi:hypothetical protein